jgi:hypothetical protein
MTILITGNTDVLLQASVSARPRSIDTSVEDLEVGPATRIPVEKVGARDVVLDPEAMVAGQAYTYELDGARYVAIRDESGRLDFYQLPTV